MHKYINTFKWMFSLKRVTLIEHVLQHSSHCSKYLCHCLYLWIFRANKHISVEFWKLPEACKCQDWEIKPWFNWIFFLSFFLLQLVIKQGKSIWSNGIDFLVWFIKWSWRLKKGLNNDNTINRTSQGGYSERSNVQVHLVCV